MPIKRKFKFQIAMAGIIFLLTFGITWQIKGVQKNNAATAQISNRVETLQLDLKNEMAKNEDLMRQILSLKDDINKYRDKSAESDGISTVLRGELSKAETMAGLTDVEGSGIIVTLKDGAANLAGQEVSGFVMDAGYGIVHDAQILSLVNELRAAGAEALSLNDERILSTSEFRCAGPTVSINNTKKAAPFVIKAIGDPDNMENALRMPNGILDELKFSGVDVTVRKSGKLTINKYGGTPTYKYATEVKTEEGGAQ